MKIETKFNIGDIMIRISRNLDTSWGMIISITIICEEDKRTVFYTFGNGMTHTEDFIWDKPYAVEILDMLEKYEFILTSNQETAHKILSKISDGKTKNVFDYFSRVLEDIKIYKESGDKQ